MTLKTYRACSLDALFTRLVCVCVMTRPLFALENRHVSVIWSMTLEETGLC